MQSANAQVLLLQGQAGQLAQENATLQRRAEAAEAQRDAAARQAEETIAELQRHARDREAALQRRAETAEARVLELARELERAQQNARLLGVRPVAQALSGGVSTASHAELAAATHNFAVGSILGRGGFGAVYRGEWGGQAVAIKRLDQASPAQPAPLGTVSCQGFMSYQTEHFVQNVVSALSHIRVSSY